MAFSRNTGHLVAGCEEGCYAWKISDTNSMKKHRLHCSASFMFASNHVKSFDKLITTSSTRVWEYTFCELFILDRLHVLCTTLSLSRNKII